MKKKKSKAKEDISSVSKDGSLTCSLSEDEIARLYSSYDQGFSFVKYMIEKMTFEILLEEVLERLKDLKLKNDDDGFWKNLFETLIKQSLTAGILAANDPNFK